MPHHEKPLVSVIMPCYNHGKYLATAIESALNQTYQNVEVIVVDDGSTDNSGKVAKSFGDRITYIYQENAGQSAARNTAIRHSRGKYLAMLDADDLWLPHKLEVQIPAFDLADNVGLVFGAYRSISETNAESVIEAPGAECDLQHELLRACYPGCLTVVMPRAVFDDVGEFDTSLRNAQDWDMWLRIARKYAIVAVDEIVGIYRSVEGSQSKNNQRMFACRMKILTADRMFHASCKECRHALRDGRRAAHVSVSAEFCAAARRFFRERNYLQAIVHTALAINHEPRSIRRLAMRLRSGAILD